ncbi:MAG: dihydrofolate reductase [Flavobacteriales bacterium]|nr:dihydrofolate reductase [Flavobacteriales bacterium]
MNKTFLSAGIIAAVMLASCGTPEKKESAEVKEEMHEAEDHDSGEFNYTADQFADLKLIRYQVPGFDELDLGKKELLYYLYEAALSGRDLMYAQNYQHNLQIRKTLEEVVEKGGEGDDFLKLEEYLKRVWFSSGIHHHYSNQKFEPEFSREYFEGAINAIADENLPLKEGQSKADLIATLGEVIFNPEVAPLKVNLDQDADIVATSAVNFYGEDVTQAEVEAYYASLDKVEGNQPEYGLNTRLVKEDGKIVAQTMKVGGLYTEAIEKIVFWLEKALPLAENAEQKLTFERLIAYYKTGNVLDWDQYNLAWIKDSESRTDVVNGFIEVYNDPLGKKGSFESVVSFKDMEATKRIEAVSKEAQWFEDNSPLMEEHKKKNVTGIIGKVITVVVEAGDASPSTPIGINLPNNGWVREVGSKSVSLGNIVHAYEMSSKEGKSSLSEFAYFQEEIDRSKKYGGIADLLHTDLHEVIGHASGRINEGVGTTSETLKSYASALEEGRADLVALYFLHDQKLVDMGLIESLEVGKTAYDDYIKNGMMLQLKRLKVGDEVQEAHMRNRQMIAKWAVEAGAKDTVIERVVKEGKTYFVINDYEKLKEIFGMQLRELQRIKSEGDYEAGKALVENYAVKVDPELHAEVLKRYESLGIAAYGGFTNPKLVATMDGDKVSGVSVEYPENFKEQMMYYSKNYSFLPVK